MGASHSSQWVRLCPCGNWLRARLMPSFTVASIWSCTAPSPAQPVAIWPPVEVPVEGEDNSAEMNDMVTAIVDFTCPGSSYWYSERQISGVRRLTVCAQVFVRTRV